MDWPKTFVLLRVTGMTREEMNAVQQKYALDGAQVWWVYTGDELFTRSWRDWRDVPFAA